MDDVSTSANNPMAWADDGACRSRDQAIFFPVEYGAGHHRPLPEDMMADARAICGPCPVFADCHRHAIEHETEGIWAATDPHQRRRLRRAMGLSDLLQLGPRTKDEERTGATPPPVRA